jgi:signal transduction histidine kinase
MHFPEPLLRCADEGFVTPSDSAVTTCEGLARSDVVARIDIAEWSGELRLVGALRGGAPRQNRRLQSFVAEAAPGLYNVYLASRVRARTLTDERTRFARELHDGAIQTLIGAEMRLEALGRRTGASGWTVVAGTELKTIQSILRQEVLGLRDLMVRVKPLEMTPEQLPNHLSLMANRFSRDSGIATDLKFDGLALGPVRQHHHEIARIVQEGLSNIRKHSGATRAQVTLHTAANGAWVSIEDNGRGFPFEGRVLIAPSSYREAGGLPSGLPESLRELVQSLGGELAIESQPGRGARLEIVIPAAKAESARRAAS